MSIPTDHRLAASAVGEVALAVLAELPDTHVLVFDGDLRVRLASGELLTQGCSDAHDLAGRPVQDLLDAEHYVVCEPLLKAALRGQANTVEMWSADGLCCYAVQVAPFPQLAERAGVAVFADVTRRRHADEARRHAQERFELMFEHAPVGAALATTDGRLVRVNPALLAMTGYDAEDLLRKTLHELTHPDDRSVDAEQLRRLLAGEVSVYRTAKRYMHARGHVISAQLTFCLVRGREGEPLHFIAQIEDHSEQSLLERRLAELEERDRLTGLVNRRHFEHELGRTVTHCLGGDRSAALVVLDLDGFRRVNETYGHRVGDELLVQIAAGLSRRLRGNDLVARLDGAEFAVILADADAHTAEAVAGDLAGIVAGCTLEVNSSRISVTASVGVAHIGANAGDEDRVLNIAERAARAARRSPLSLVAGR